MDNDRKIKRNNKVARNDLILKYYFKLIAELLILPAIAFLALLDAIAGTKPEYTLVKKLTSFLMILD